MITDYKERVRKMNVKENWAVLRYIGESDGNSGAFGGFTHGRYYYSPGIKEARGGYFHIFDNEEIFTITCTSDRERWEIAEDSTGMAAKLLYADNSEGDG